MSGASLTSCPASGTRGWYPWPMARQLLRLEASVLHDLLGDRPLAPDVGGELLGRVGAGHEAAREEMAIAEFRLADDLADILRHLVDDRLRGTGRGEDAVPA